MVDAKFIFNIIKDEYTEESLIQFIRDSEYFDSDYYLSTNEDVRKANYPAPSHYYQFGWKEGRKPSDKKIPDAPPNVCPILYYEIIGKHIKNNEKKYAYNLVKKSKMFNKNWYLKTYKDVAEAKIDPVEHYINNGWKENRDPSALFNTSTYLDEYPSRNKMCPLIYYEILKDGLEKDFSRRGVKKNLKSYKGRYELNLKYDSFDTSVRTFAFYLPQFHCIKENDEWWGEGFTEWTNTKKAKPCFEGHYEPRNPHKDVGFYDLTNVDVIRKQANLARQHNISGFAFYYYWFSGKRLLEKPMDILLQNKDIDIEYCIIWANENWTKTWDGLEKDILIKQEYTDDDPINFMNDIKKYILDNRYLRIDGKPVIILYAPQLIPNLKNAIAKYRDQARKNGIGEIELWVCRTHDTNAYKLDIFDLVDGEVEFPPHNVGMIPFESVKKNNKDAYLFDYNLLVKKKIEEMKIDTIVDSKLHRTVMLDWDNSPRRDNFSAFTNFSYEDYYMWLREVTIFTENSYEGEKKIQFVNAWNEWAEGTYLEPDDKYGYSAINHTSQAILDRPFISQSNVQKLRNKDLSGSIRIAIHAHIFYEELIKEITENLNYISIPYDIYVSTDDVKKKEYLENYLSKKSTARLIEVKVFKNRGRDVAPFLEQMANKINQYDYICHIHTKKSKHQDDHNFGDRWREYLYRNLFGSKENIINIIGMFESYPEIGIICPDTFTPLLKWMKWGQNKEKVMDILIKTGVEKPDLPEYPDFPAGNMFWMRATAVKPIFDLSLKQQDFEEEKGQVDATLAHAIERSWFYVLMNNNYIWIIHNVVSSEMILNEPDTQSRFKTYFNMTLTSLRDSFK